MNTKIGSTLVYKNIKGFYAYLQKWISGRWISHVALSIGRLIKLDFLYEAAEINSANPFNSDNPHIEIWECTFSEENLGQALNEVTRSSYGWLYNILGILYFPRRWVYEHVPFLWTLRKMFSDVKDVRQLNNWFARGYICTKYWYRVMQKAAGYEGAQDFLDKLQEWNANNLYASDVVEIMRRFENKYFICTKRVMEK